MRRIGKPVFVFCATVLTLGIAGLSMAQQAPRGRSESGGESSAEDVSSQRRPLRSGPARQPSERPPSQADRRTKPLAPFTLTSEEMATLTMVLQAWEKRSDRVKSLTCEFTLWEYNSVFPGADESGGEREQRKSTGEIKYKAPDRGLYRVEGGEYWICDGKAIYEHDFNKKQLIERRLPEELQGKAISEGPLPFLFGANADKMLSRYWMRIITPQDAQGEIWLEAYPRYRLDAANFQKVEIILREKDLMPTAMQLWLPNGGSRTVYAFHSHSVNNPVQKLLGFFDAPRTPLGWKRVVEEPRGPQASGDGAPAPEGRGQARRAPSDRSAQ